MIELHESKQTSKETVQKIKQSYQERKLTVRNLLSHIKKEYNTVVRISLNSARRECQICGWSEENPNPNSKVRIHYSANALKKLRRVHEGCKSYLALVSTV